MIDKLIKNMKCNPAVSAVILTSLKTSSVDIFVQKTIEKKNKIDWKRNSTFLIFGFFYQGMWQYYLFNKLMPRLLPGILNYSKKTLVEKIKDKQGIKNVFLQNFIENGLNNPFLFFPTFYLIQEIIQNNNKEECCKNAINKYYNNFWKDITACWILWIPAQTINFAFSPKWFRVPFVAGVSALWTGYVSYYRST
jgi:hypothetical protein